MIDPKDPYPSGPPPGDQAKDGLESAYEALVSEYRGGDKSKGVKADREKVPGGKAEKKDDLVDAYKHVLADDERRRNQAVLKEVGARRVIAPMALTILVAISAYLWLGKPFDNQIPIPPVTVPDTHALRQLMVVATQMIEQYRQEKGRLPTTLAEVGIDAGPVTYLLTAPDYSLRGVVGDSTITLRWSVASAEQIELEAHGKGEKL